MCLQLQDYIEDYSDKNKYHIGDIILYNMDEQYEGKILGIHNIHDTIWYEVLTKFDNIKSINEITESDIIKLIREGK